MGFGLLVLPISVIANIFSFISLATILKRHEKYKNFVWNQIGAVWCTTWLIVVAINWTF